MKKVPVHYSLVKEHQHSYEIHDKRDDSKFHVAKGSLDLQMHGKLASLPHYAGGTASVDSALDAINSPNAVAPRSEANSDFQSPYSGNFAGLQMGLDNIATSLPESPNIYDDSGKIPTMSDYYPQMSVPQTRPNVVPSSRTPTSAQETAQSEQPAAQPMQDQSASLGMTPAMGAGLMGQFKANEAQTEAGAKAVGAGQAAQAKEESESREQSNWNLQGLMNDAQAEREAFDWKNQKLAEQVAEAKIDPKNYMHSMGAGNRILAAIAMAVGGAGAAISGQKNLAHEVIQDAINKDIEAQKMNLDTKKSLLSQNLEKYKDMRLAQQATFMQMQAMAQGQVAQIAAKHGAAIDQGKTQMLLGQMKQDSLMKGFQLQQGIMQFGISRQAISGGGIPAAALPALPPEQRKQMVVLPNGNYADAGSPENAKAVNEEIAPFKPLMQDLQTLKGLNTPETLLDPQKRAQAHALTLHVVTQLNDLAKSHRISESDIGFQQGQLSDPTSATAMILGKGTAATDQLMRSVTNKVDSTYQTYVPAYRGQRVSSPAVSSQEGKTASDAKGNKLVMKSGKWVPLNGR